MFNQYLIESSLTKVESNFNLAKVFLKFIFAKIESNFNLVKLQPNIILIKVVPNFDSTWVSSRFSQINMSLIYK
jgi:hypothetical protein